MRRLLLVGALLLPVSAFGQALQAPNNLSDVPNPAVARTNLGALATNGNGSALTGLTNSQVAGSAPTASPTFTGTVTLPAGQVVNGVTLTTGGSATTYLNGAGAYTTPSGSGSVSLTGSAGVQVSPSPITGTGVISGTALLGNGGSVVTTGSYTIQAGDAGRAIRYTGTGAAAFSLPSATTTGFGVGFGTTVVNDASSGNITVTPTTSTIRGASTMTIAPATQCQIISDGTNYYGAACTAITPGSGGGGLTVGSTTIAGGAAGSLLYDNGPGTLNEQTLSAAMDATLGNVQGDVLYRSATGWTVLAPGTSGNVLTTGGASANPSWQPGSTTSSVITATSANAFAVGQNGTTNPAFNVDTSTASSATGITVKSAAAAAGVTVTATSSAVSEGISVLSKGAGAATFGTAGTGQVNLAANSTTQLSVSTVQFHIVEGAGAFQHFVYNSPNEASTALTASTAIPQWNVTATTRQWATGAGPTIQSEFQFGQPTYAAVAASTFPEVATFYVAGAPKAGTNMTQTLSETARFDGGAVASGTTTAYALTLNPPTGATNNYSMNLAGDINFTGTIPTASAGTITTGSTDHRGQVSGLSAATTLTITFAGKLGVADACNIIGVGATIAAPQITSISQTAVTFGFTAFTGTVAYMCF